MPLSLYPWEKHPYPLDRRVNGTLRRHGEEEEEEDPFTGPTRHRTPVVQPEA